MGEQSAMLTMLISGPKGVGRETCVPQRCRLLVVSNTNTFRIVVAMITILLVIYAIKRAGRFFMVANIIIDGCVQT